MDSAVDDRYSIRSVERALAIVQFVAEAGRELSVDEIVAGIGLAKTTVFRLLATLTARQFLARDGQTQAYRLGSLAVFVGARGLGSLDVRRIARRHLVTLMEAAGETVHLSVLSQEAALCVDKIDSTRSMRMSSYIGFRDPLHCSGVGKVLLAFQDDQTLAALLDGMSMEVHTVHTIVDKAELHGELASIRKQGFAIDFEEIEDDVCCVAAPVHDHEGVVVAAVSVSGPTSRVNQTTLPDLIPTVKHAALAISRDLGWREVGAKK
jgi:DNA-binding IclR family transcriptional regulator